jgi:hypothetical protein
MVCYTGTAHTWRLVNVEVTENVSDEDTPGIDAGNGCSLQIENIDIHHHTIGSATGGRILQVGGHVDANLTNVVIRDTRIVAANPNYDFILLSYTTQNTIRVVMNNVYIRNTAFEVQGRYAKATQIRTNTEVLVPEGRVFEISNWVLGPATSLEESTAVLVQGRLEVLGSLFVSGVTGSHGAALWLQNSADVTIVNADILGNRCGDAGQVVACDGGVAVYAGPGANVTLGRGVYIGKNIAWPTSAASAVLCADRLDAGGSWPYTGRMVRRWDWLFVGGWKVLIHIVGARLSVSLMSARLLPLSPPFSLP